MSQILTPGERPDAWGLIGDLRRRVAILEAVPADTAVQLLGVTAWILAMSSYIELPPTVGGAGFDGSDWALVPVTGTSPYPLAYDSGVAETNAASLTTGAGDINNPDAGDLFNAGIFIYKTYSPLTDYGFVSGDKASSIRIMAGFPGVYKVTLRAIAKGEAGTNQMLGVAAQFGNMFDPNIMLGGTPAANPTFALAGFANSNPGTPPNFGKSRSALFTDPGSPLPNASTPLIGTVNTPYLKGEYMGLVVVDDDGLPADIVIRAWNPGPDDMLFDLGVLVEKMDSSAGALFGE